MNGIKIGGLIVLVLAVALSGCVSQDNPKSSVDSQKVVSTPSPATSPAKYVPSGPAPLSTSKTPPPPLNIPGSVTPKATSPKAEVKSGIAVPDDLLVRPEDAPGLSLADYSYYAVKTDEVYADPIYQRVTVYKGALPAGMRNVGQESKWLLSTGQADDVQVRKFDSKVSINGSIPASLITCEKDKKIRETSCGSANIGNISYYRDSPVPNGNTQNTILYFVKDNYHVSIKVSYKIGDSHDEAFQLAEKIERRLK